jgi:antitoxin component of RelBE/YafQ-DinJ toxin-antitoxin module
MTKTFGIRISIDSNIPTRTKKIADAMRLQYSDLLEIWLKMTERGEITINENQITELMKAKRLASRESKMFGVRVSTDSDIPARTKKIADAMRLQNSDLLEIWLGMTERKEITINGGNGENAKQASKQEQDIIQLTTQTEHLTEQLTVQTEQLTTLTARMDQLISNFELKFSYLETKLAELMKIKELQVLEAEEQEEQRLFEAEIAQFQPTDEDKEELFLDRAIYIETLLARIEEMQKAGMSTRAIAETFNEEGLRTLRGTGKWHGGSITNLQKREQLKKNRDEHLEQDLL